jgi:hypothetical protein
LATDPDFGRDAAIARKEIMEHHFKPAGLITSRSGGFKFNANPYPSQSSYLTKVAERPDRKF